MSDTPRTDAACGVPSNDWEATANRLCECSMQLERELSVARELIGRARGYLVFGTKDPFEPKLAALIDEIDGRR